MTDDKRIPEWAITYPGRAFPTFGYTGDLIALALNDEGTGLDGVFVLRGEGGPFAGLVAWPGGFVRRDEDADALQAALREFKEETGQGNIPYVEELGTFDKSGRDPRQFAGHWKDDEWVSEGVRVVSKAHLALLRKEGRVLAPQGEQDVDRAFWKDIYKYLPWEDLRSTTGEKMLRAIRLELDAWSAARGADAVVRFEQAFGKSEDGADWNEERVRERFDLMYEAGIVEEAHRDIWGRVLSQPETVYGKTLSFDHRFMLASALGRLRGKIKYRPALLAALLPAEFTLRDLRHAVESIGGRKLHRPNFHRTVARSQNYKIVHESGNTETNTGGRPAELYQFGADVNLLRLDPSIRMPWL